MALIGLLFAHHGAGPDGEPPAMLAVAGLSVIERQVRQARRCGAGRVIVVVERMPPALAATLAGLDVEIIRAADGFALDNDDRVLVIEDALAVDRRIVDALLAKGGIAVAIWKGRNGPDRSQRIDPASHWAGVGIYPSALVSNVLGGLGDWDLQETLLRAAFTEEKPVRLDVASIDTYDPHLRRVVPLLWAPIHGEADVAQAGERLVAEGCTPLSGWPAHYIYRNVEGALVRSLLSTRIPQNFVVMAAGVLGVAATISFAIGWLWIGLLLALLTAPIEGVADRLAWLRHENHDQDSLREILRKIVEYSWYIALAGYLALERDPSGPWALTALILLASFGSSVQRGIFNRLTGRSLDDAGSFEQRLRFLAAGRNANLWLLLPFAAFGAWYAGLIVLAIYAVVTHLFVQARFFVRLVEYARSHSPRMAANLAEESARDAAFIQRWLSPK